MRWLAYVSRMVQLKPKLKKSIMLKTADKNTITESLKKLEAIVQWFEKQEDLDLEEGLKRIKEGAAIARELKEKVKRVENEFSEIKKGLDSSE